MALANLYQFIDGVLDILFEPEVRRLEGIVTDLDAANREIRGLTIPGFIHNGQTYVPKTAKVRPSRFPSLAFQLTNRAAEWVLDQKAVEEDRQMIRQVLWLATKDCKTMGEVRDAIPESIVELVPSMRNMQRNREDGYTLQHDDRLYGQYLRIRDKIDVYWACRMVY